MVAANQTLQMESFFSNLFCALVSRYQTTHPQVLSRNAWDLSHFRRTGPVKQLWTCQRICEPRYIPCSVNWVSRKNGYSKLMGRDISWNPGARRGRGWRDFTFLKKYRESFKTLRPFASFVRHRNNEFLLAVD